MFDFVPPEDEQVVDESRGTVGFRPNRMGLGCSSEEILEKISSNAKMARLEKLLKRKGALDDGLSESMKRSELIDDDIKKSDHIVKKEISKIEPITNTTLSKSQKKRQKKNLKHTQKKLLA